MTVNCNDDEKLLRHLVEVLMRNTDFCMRVDDMLILYSILCKSKQVMTCCICMCICVCCLSVMGICCSGRFTFFAILN